MIAKQRPSMRGHARKRPTILPEPEKLLWNLHDLGGVLKRVGEATSQAEIPSMPGLFLKSANDNLAPPLSDTLHPTLWILGFVCKWISFQDVLSFARRENRFFNPLF